MNIIRVLPFLCFLSLFSTLSADASSGSDQYKYLKKLVKKMNITLILVDDASNDNVDSCIIEQTKHFYKQFKKLSRKKRSAFLSQANIKSIMFHPVKLSGEVRGELIKLQLLETIWSGDMFFDIVKDEKVIQDARIGMNLIRRNDLIKSSSRIDITINKVLTDYQTKNYRTFYNRAFKEITDIESLKLAMLEGFIEQRPEVKVSPKYHCGTLELTDLI